MATRRKGKKGKKGKGRIRKWVGRWAWRKVHTWATRTRARARRAFQPRTIHASAKQRVWERQFPNPRRQPSLAETMEKLDEWMEGYEAVFANGWHVPFEIDTYRAATLREAAYDAAELAHGTVARSLQIIEIRPVNELAEQALRRFQ